MRIRLLNFFKRMDKEGIDLRGCVIRGQKYNYKFKDIIDNGTTVQVWYGAEFENVGNLIGYMPILDVAMTVRPAHLSDIGRSRIVIYTDTNP